MNCRILCLLVVLLAAGVAHAQDRSLMAREQRVALVVGNSAYANAPLRNPGNDADDVAAALQNLGFRVTRLKDASNRQMVEAINRFGQELRKGGVGLFFFAGHGIQSRGRNFLIPVGANISAEEQLEFESVDANRVLAAMDAAGNRVNIVILDACRDNPYARSFRSASRGLAQMEAAKGSLVAFATGPGSVAADGVGRNGLYTQHLLQSLNHPDSDIDKVFRRVTADVTRMSGNKQVPWKSDSLTGEFYFRLDGGGANVALAPPSVPAPQVDARADDRALWETVKDSNNAAELQAYLDQFPNGVFAGVARARLKTLASAGPPMRVATTQQTVPAATMGAFANFTHENNPRNLKALFERVHQDVYVRKDAGRAAALFRSLLPDEERTKKALKDNVAPDTAKQLKGMHEKLGASITPGDINKIARATQTVVQVHGATTEDIIRYREGSVAHKEFPGGARRVAEQMLHPGMTFYEVEFLEPGKDAGMKYHLLYWDGRQWSMLGPVWRVMREDKK